MIWFLKKKETTKPAAKVVPRIKTPLFEKALLDTPGMDQSNMPPCVPVVGDLLVTYSLDIGPSYVSASPAACKEYGADFNDLQRLGIQSCLNLLADIKTKTDGVVYQMLVGNDMEATTILFPDLWRQISGELASDVLAIFPHRNAVFYAPSNLGQSKAALQKLIDQTDFNETHALSRHLYLFADSKWSVVS
jgi:hypothetical protein